MFKKPLVFCQHCGNLISTDIKKGRWSYLFCPKCKNARVNKQIAVNAVHNAFNSLSNLPHDNLNNVLKIVEKKMLNDTKIEREAKLRLERKLSEYASQKDRLVDLFTLGSITHDQYHKKLQLIDQEQRLDEDKLLSMSDINTKLSISLKTLVNLVSHSSQIFESSKFDEKRKLLRILFSNFILDGKNPVFSIRKPVLTLVKTGSNPKWQGRQEIHAPAIFAFNSLKFQHFTLLKY